MIDGAKVTQLLRKHRAALTRAKKKGPQAVLQATRAAFADFETYGYPDQWSEFQRAQDDAQFEIERTRKTW